MLAAVAEADDAMATDTLAAVASSSVDSDISDGGKTMVAAIETVVAIAGAVSTLAAMAAIEVLWSR